MSLPMPGDRIPVSASRTRDVDRMRADYRARRIPRGGLVTPRRPGVVLAKNQTGGNLGFGVPAILTNEYPPLNPTGTPVKDWDAAQKMLYRLAPSASMTSSNPYPAQAIAITTEPIANNAIGEVIIQGLAIATVAPGLAGSYRPAVGSVTTSSWGWGKQVTESPGENFSVIDLSYRKLVALYEITAVSGSTITGKIDPGSANEFTDTLFDSYGIASWQIAGDRGQCEWTGAQWVITNPWCAS